MSQMLTVAASEQGITGHYRYFMGFSPLQMLYNEHITLMVKEKNSKTIPQN